jgi:hypothetical protein
LYDFDAQKSAFANLKEPSRPRTQKCLGIVGLFAVNLYSTLLDQAVCGRRALHETSLLQ